MCYPSRGGAFLFLRFACICVVEKSTIGVAYICINKSYVVPEHSRTSSSNLDDFLSSHMQKTTSCRVRCSTANPPSPIFFCTFITAYVAYVIDCWMKLDLWEKGQALWELHSPHAFRSTGHSLGHFLTGAFFKRACAAVPAKGSTVGQLPIELQPLFCGGVGQIRPHNCLPSQTGTAASLRPLRKTCHRLLFLWGAICEEWARHGDQNDCSTVLPLSLLGVIWMAP